MPAITLPDYAYTPQLRWSSTRSETFRSCRRRYFFQYYGRYDCELQPWQIQRLKGLSSIPMTVGESGCRWPWQLKSGQAAEQPRRLQQSQQLHFSAI